MGIVTCLLGVSMTYFRPSDETWGYIEDIEGNGVTGGYVYNPEGYNWEELFEVLEIHNKDGTSFRRDPTGRFRVIREWAEFEFCHMGEINGEYVSPLQWLVESAGAEDVIMEDDWPILFNMGKQLLAKEKNKSPDKLSIANFVTVWEYGGEYNYFGEYDEWWELRGRLDMDKLIVK